jgi:arginase
MHFLNDRERILRTDSIPCIGLASGAGAGNRGCGDGPLYLKKSLGLTWQRMINPIDNATIAALNSELAMSAKLVADTRQFFLSFGGDHSCAIGTWSGVSESYRQEGDIGLIWIDAHMDAHTQETSPSGNLHGMPLAVLLGYGDPTLTNILSSLPKVKPENVVLIGIRSFEESEEALLATLNVQIYYADQVKTMGLANILQMVIHDLSKRTVGYGVSFDVDAIDPSVVSATGTPVPDGIDGEEMLSSLTLFNIHRPLAFELVEYNPNLDEDGSTFMYIKRLLSKLTDRFYDNCKHF